MRVQQVPAICFILTLALAGCAPAAEQAPSAAVVDSPAAEPPSQSEGSQAKPAENGAAVITVDAADACALFSQAQVESAFGKTVEEVNPVTELLGDECEYVFDNEADTSVRVSFYEGAVAKQFFTALITASDESCEALFDTLFDTAFGQQLETGQDLSTTSLADLYQQYYAALSNCMYVHSEDRADVGENVTAIELIFLNWSSNLAVLGDERVVEITYQEPISPEADTAFETATDRDSFYAAAQPYRDAVLAGYTNILVGLLHEATGQ